MLVHLSARRAAPILMGILTVAATVSGCSQQFPIAAPTTPSKMNQIQAVPFDLYTHCGINELSAYGKYFQHVGGSLTDGSGNPPSGWGNPFQRGTLSISGDVAIFRDKVGHVESFKVRPSATRSLNICS